MCVAREREFARCSGLREELVAKDVAGFVELAVALAADGARRDRYHAALREKMQSGILCDGVRFADAFRSGRCGRLSCCYSDSIRTSRGCAGLR